jgi:dethiobiotin synthetase
MNHSAVFPATFPFTVESESVNLAGSAHNIGSEFLEQIIENIKKTKEALKKAPQKKSHRPLCLFITGTDTDVGKTYMSVKLLHLLNQAGLKTIGLKPIASGCVKNKKTGELENEDALKLQDAASIKLPYHDINPFAFELPIAPHIAAEKEKISLSAKILAESTQEIIEKYSANPDSPNFPDVIVIEGAGGWEVPLNQSKSNPETLADYVALLNSNLKKHAGEDSNLKVILIVGMKLGCLNHALLTFKSIKEKGVEIFGWIPNCPPHFSSEGPMPFLKENIETLTSMTQSIRA